MTKRYTVARVDHAAATVADVEAAARGHNRSIGVLTLSPRGLPSDRAVRARGIRT